MTTVDSGGKSYGLIYVIIGQRVAVDGGWLTGFGEDLRAVVRKRAGIWIIEGLNLKEVPPGPVKLVCLPIRIAGGDGAPARVLARPGGRLGKKRR